MGDGRNILDHRHFKSCRLQGADGGFTAGAGSLDENFNRLQTMLHGCLGGRLCRSLRGERSGFLAATETESAGGSPGNGVSGRVGAGDHGVIERRADMNLALFNILTLSAALRVRALVLLL